ncbi:MAG TPA: DUF6754 domain-containing protein, partial [Thermoplasmata archaeon]|nr:DUF6754 domain-containing protein [Thermoplasmata archaeon]
GRFGSPTLRRSTLLLAFASAISLLPGIGSAFPLNAVDTPDDGGRRITVSWTIPASPPAQWQVLRSEGSGPLAVVDTIAGTLDSFHDEGVRDEGIQNGRSYRYQLVAMPADPAQDSEVSQTAVPAASWFDSGKTNVFLATIVFLGLVLFYIWRAQGGKMWTFRAIAGLAAIEEAIGRSTEMGKGVLYVPGVQDIDDIQTIASMIILGNVARMTAKYETPLLVPTNSPAVYTVADEVVKAGYSDVGRVDAYRSDQVRYITTEQFAYVAAVNGIMLRERPAANLFLGAFFAESLLLAETGHETGAIQIAGTANVHQLPFFVVACDYTLIGEEYYAASAYLSKDPRLLGSLKASDTLKILLIAFILVAVVSLTLGHSQLAEFFATQ